MGGSNFSINWPSEARPASVTTPFNTTTGALAINAPGGTKIKAGVAGKVTAAGGSSLVKACNCERMIFNEHGSIPMTAAGF